MNGFHSFSSAAFFAKNPGRKLTMSLPDIYCTVISALQWRKNGNSITMLTDSAGAELFSALGINDIWNDIRIVIPDDLDGIDPVMFWAGGKLIALQQFPAQCAMIDTDFIVWEDPPFEDKIIAAHEEDLMPSVYPDVSSFRLKGKVLDEGLDYTTLPLNTAFLYIPDEDFKQYYTSRSIAFMKSAVYGGDYLPIWFSPNRDCSLCLQKGAASDTPRFLTRTGYFCLKADIRICGVQSRKCVMTRRSLTSSVSGAGKG